MKKRSSALPGLKKKLGNFRKGRSNFSGIDGSERNRRSSGSTSTSNVDGSVHSRVSGGGGSASASVATTVRTGGRTAPAPAPSRPVGIQSRVEGTIATFRAAPMSAARISDDDDEGISSDSVVDGVDDGLDLEDLRSFPSAHTEDALLAGSAGLSPPESPAVHRTFAGDGKAGGGGRKPARRWGSTSPTRPLPHHHRDPPIHHMPQQLSPQSRGRPRERQQRHRHPPSEPQHLRPLSPEESVFSKDAPSSSRSRSVAGSGARETPSDQLDDDALSEWWFLSSKSESFSDVGGEMGIEMGGGEVPFSPTSLPSFGDTSHSSGVVRARRSPPPSTVSSPNAGRPLPPVPTGEADRFWVEAASTTETKATAPVVGASEGAAEPHPSDGESAGWKRERQPGVPSTGGENEGTYTPPVAVPLSDYCGEEVPPSRHSPQQTREHPLLWDAQPGHEHHLSPQQQEQQQQQHTTRLSPDTLAHLKYLKRHPQLGGEYTLKEQRIRQQWMAARSAQAVQGETLNYNYVDAGTGGEVGAAETDAGEESSTSSSVRYHFAAVATGRNAVATGRNEDWDMSLQHKHYSMERSRSNIGLGVGGETMAAPATVSNVAGEETMEWTPQDSSYGAALPAFGWVPKRIRKVMELTVYVLFLALLIYMIVRTGIRLNSGGWGSSGSGGGGNGDGYDKSDDIGSDDDYYVENTESSADEDDWYTDDGSNKRLGRIRRS